MFLAGPVGSHSPRPQRRARRCRSNWEALAAERWPRSRASPDQRGLCSGRASVEADLPELQNRVTDSLPPPPLGRAPAAAPLAPPGTFLQAMRLRDAVWCSTPCDYSGELALDLEGAACQLGLTAAVTSFNGITSAT